MKPGVQIIPMLLDNGQQRMSGCNPRQSPVLQSYISTRTPGCFCPSTPLRVTKVKSSVRGTKVAVDVASPSTDLTSQHPLHAACLFCVPVCFELPPTRFAMDTPRMVLGISPFGSGLAGRWFFYFGFRIVNCGF